MADRILTWYIPEVVGDGTRQGPTFCMERDYHPQHVRIYAADAPDADNLEVDIKDDGVSICTNKPVLLKGQKSEEMGEDFSTNADNVIEKYSWVSLDISQSGGAKKITVQLEVTEALGVNADDTEDEDE